MIGVVMMMTSGMAAGLTRMACSNHGVVSSGRISLRIGHYRPMKKGHEAKHDGYGHTNKSIG